MDALIRLARSDDAQAVSRIYRPFVESSATSFEAVAPASEEMANRIERATRTHPWLVCEIDDAIAGYAYATPHRERAAYQWSVETSVYVDPTYHRRSVGRGLYTALLGILVAQRYANAYAGITLPNRASVSFHEAMGFSAIGVFRRVGYKNGAWHDVGWWSMSLGHAESEPRTPALLEEAADTAAWHTSLAAGTRLVQAGTS